MAPEILRDEALPSTVSDLHSLAVLLFYLLMHGHPLLGIRADASYTWDGAHMSETELLVRNFGIEPLFVFDPDDPSNRPLPGDRVVTWWALYPQECRRVFTHAFTAGLHDASLHGRVTEGTWRRTLLRLHDCVSSCPALRCGSCFTTPEQSAQPCWHCQAALPVAARLYLPGGTLVLTEGAVVTCHHVYRDRDYRTAQATVEPHPRRAGGLVLRNLTQAPWLVAPDGEEPKTVAPGQRLAVRPMDIDFNGVHGRILLRDAPPDLMSPPCPSTDADEDSLRL